MADVVGGEGIVRSDETKSPRRSLHDCKRELEGLPEGRGKPIGGKWGEWVKRVAGNEEKWKKGYVDLQPAAGNSYGSETPVVVDRQEDNNKTAIEMALITRTQEDFGRPQRERGRPHQHLPR